MGIVYVMTNPFMPGLVKIGRTKADVAARRRDLSSASGVPVPFNIHYAGEVENEEFIESRLHAAFSDHRINLKREFFRIAPERVVAAIQIANPKDVTPTDQKFETPEEGRAVEQEVQRRDRLRLDRIGIPVGAELVFSRDENIKATVAPNSKIDFNGNIVSLSAAAKEILDSKGKYSNVSGSVYWTYEGETLEERRLRLEDEELGESD